MKKVYCNHHCEYGVCSQEDWDAVISGENPSKMVKVRFSGFQHSVPFHTLIEEEDIIGKAFGDLMGINGDKFITEIYNTNKLSQSSYNAICDNISFNSRNSIEKHFGLIHWYYLQGKK